MSWAEETSPHDIFKYNIMFSGLRQGALVYVLDKSDKIQVKQGFVESVSAPRSMYKTFNPAVTFGTNMQSVVDITLKIDDQKKEFVGIPSNVTIHSYGDYVITESKEGMIQEVDAMLQNSTNIVNSIDKHRQIISSCENILKELNPVYAREQERDEVIGSLTQKVNSIEGVLTRLESMLAKQENHDNDKEL